MVTRSLNRRSRERAGLMIELLVAMSLLLAALFPVAYSVVSEQRLALAYYQRAVALEIVDGEMEVLAAGEWRSFAPGTHDYVPKAAAAANLPPGRMLLTLEPDKVRLEWRPSVPRHGGPVVRELKLK